LYRAIGAQLIVNDRTLLAVSATGTYGFLFPYRELRILGLILMISERGKPAPLWATKRCVVERTNSWQAKLAHKKLGWCIERKGSVIALWIAFSEVVIVVRRLIQEAWERSLWEPDLTAARKLLADALSPKPALHPKKWIKVVIADSKCP
jgi:hypothetical protein